MVAHVWRPVSFKDRRGNPSLTIRVFANSTPLQNPHSLKPPPYIDITCYGNIKIIGNQNIKVCSCIW